MTTRSTSPNYAKLGLTVCGIIFAALTAHAQLDSDTDLTGGADAGAPPPASSSQTPTTPSAGGSAVPAPTSTAGAAPQAGGKKVGANGKRTSIDFEDELIEGQTQKPELFYLLQKRQFNYKRMIRLRDNFLPEMRKTAEEIQRKGSGD